jgi:hypothetical protein
VGGWVVGAPGGARGDDPTVNKATWSNY